MTEKTCVRCNQIQPLFNFSKDKTRPDGYFPYCRTCKRKSHLASKHDKTKARARQARYYAAHRDEINTEEAKARHREWHHQQQASNPEYREAAIERARKCYHSKTPDERAAMRRRYFENDPYYKVKRLKQHLKKAYGITVEKYQAMLDAQNGVCAICGQAEEAWYKRLAVDHCHATGKVRELLCHRCNMLVGHLENGDLAEKAYAYIARHA